MIKKHDKKILCWICLQNVANSNEHMFKKSVLKLLYGNQFNNVFKFNKNEKPLPVQSIGSDQLTYENIICTDCNNNITSKHDKAFHLLTTKIYSSFDRLTAFGQFDISDLLNSKTPNDLIWIQLYFAKIFGCEVSQYLRNPGIKEKLNLSKIANSILNNKTSNKLSISFGFHRINLHGKVRLNSPELDCLFRKGGRTVIKAKWFFTFGNIVFAIKYSEIPEFEDSWWNPSLTSQTVNFVDFTDLYIERILNNT